MQSLIVFIGCVLSGIIYLIVGNALLLLGVVLALDLSGNFAFCSSSSMGRSIFFSFVCVCRTLLQN